jgi:hypothetical protein
VLLEWARSNKIDRPQLLVGRVRASGRVHNWSRRYSAMKRKQDKLRAKCDALAEDLKRIKDDELDTRERATLLKMIFAMARAMFKFDPAAAITHAWLLG